MTDREVRITDAQARAHFNSLLPSQFARDLAADLLDARAEIASLRVKLDAVCKAGYLTKLPSGQALDLSSLDVIDADGSRAHIRGENQGWFSVAKEDFEALRTYALAAALKGEK